MRLKHGGSYNTICKAGRYCTAFEKTLKTESWHINDPPWDQACHPLNPCLMKAMDTIYSQCKVLDNNRWNVKCCLEGTEECIPISDLNKVIYRGIDWFLLFFILPFVAICLLLATYCYFTVQKRYVNENYADRVDQLHSILSKRTKMTEKNFDNLLWKLKVVKFFCYVFFLDRLYKHWIDVRRQKTDLELNCGMRFDQM